MRNDLKFKHSQEPFNLERLKMLIEKLDSPEEYGTLINQDFNEITRHKSKNPIIIAGVITCLSGGMAESVQANNNFNFPSISSTLDSKQDLVSYIKCLEDIIVLEPKITKETILKEIIGFKSLCSNWDGYGAYPTEVLSTTNSVMLLDKLSKKAMESINDIFPNPNGTISFKWQNKSGERISLEVGNNSMSYYIKYNGQEVIICDDLQINNSNVEALSKSIQSL